MVLIGSDGVLGASRTVLDRDCKMHKEWGIARLLRGLQNGLINADERAQLSSRLALGMSKVDE